MQNDLDKIILLAWDGTKLREEDKTNVPHPF
jgi:hypothetical protein